MNNRVFNVNGASLGLLLTTLKLAFDQWHNKAKTTGYTIDSKKGMILFWCNIDTKYSLFPSPLSAEEVAPVVWAWLQTNPTIECKDWDANHDHDGHNELGWRVYCEDWGHIGGNHYTIVAIKPAYIWYGK